MTEADTSGRVPPPTPPASPPTPDMRWVLGLLAVVVFSLLFGVWGAWQLFAPGVGNPQRELAAQWDPLESTCRHASLSIL